MNKYSKIYMFVVSYLLIFLPIKAENTSFIIKSEGMSVSVEKIFSGLGVPWGMVFISPTQLLVTEREGNILLFDIEKNSKINLTIPVKIMVEGQGGLLDVAIPPNNNSTRWIYFTYVKNVDDEGVVVLARGKLDGAQFSSWQELLISESATSENYHFGSRITFDNKGHVYFGIGDRGERPNAQDLSNHAGTILRLNLDGSIPKDNPFVNAQSVLPEIWSYGHRNPQGLSYDFKNKRLWEIEHGPRGGDEINLIKPGKNYGWPVISYGKEYWGPVDVGESTHRKGMEQPVKVYIPSIAPGSLIIYSGNAFPKWKGNLFSGALKLRHINRVVFNVKGEAVKEERLLESLDDRIRALAQSPEGWLYFSTDSGKIYRIRPTH